MTFFNTGSTCHDRKKYAWRMVDFPIPSSISMARFPSGETPKQVMFFVVDTGKVSDRLLKKYEK